jgi:hypothetical protein
MAAPPIAAAPVLVRCICCRSGPGANASPIGPSPGGACKDRLREVA